MKRKPALGMQIALKLSRIEGRVRFLTYINTEQNSKGEDFARSETEQNCTDKVLSEVQETRSLLTRLLREHDDIISSEREKSFQLGLTRGGE